MEKAETVTDSKRNIYIIPGQMTREEAEVYFSGQPELADRAESTYELPVIDAHGNTSVAKLSNCIENMPIGDVLNI